MSLSKPSGAVKDMALGQVVKSVSNGWNIFKSIISTVGSIASMAVPFLAGGANALEAAADAGLERMANSGRQHNGWEILKPLSETAVAPVVEMVYNVMPDSGCPHWAKQMFGGVPSTRRKPDENKSDDIEDLAQTLSPASSAVSSSSSRFRVEDRSGGRNAVGPILK